MNWHESTYSFAFQIITIHTAAGSHAVPFFNLFKSKIFDIKIQCWEHLAPLPTSNRQIFNRSWGTIFSKHIFFFFHFWVALCLFWRTFEHNPYKLHFLLVSSITSQNSSRCFVAPRGRQLSAYNIKNGEHLIKEKVF